MWHLHVEAVHVTCWINWAGYLKPHLKFWSLTPYYVSYPNMTAGVKENRLLKDLAAVMSRSLLYPVHFQSSFLFQRLVKYICIKIQLLWGLVSKAHILNCIAMKTPSTLYMHIGQSASSFSNIESWNKSKQCYSCSPYKPPLYKLSTSFYRLYNKHQLKG